MSRQGFGSFDRIGFSVWRVNFCRTFFRLSCHTLKAGTRSPTEEPIESTKFLTTKFLSRDKQIFSLTENRSTEFLCGINQDLVQSAKKILLARIQTRLVDSTGMGSSVHVSREKYTTDDS